MERREEWCVSECKISVMLGTQENPLTTWVGGFFLYLSKGMRVKSLDQVLAPDQAAL